MEITINLTENELSQADITLICECLDIVNVEGAFDDAIRKLCKSAILEYLKMFKEKGLPTRADEVMQERLYFLLNHYYNDRLPSESELSTIFQLTPSQSRTLLRNTKSRYRTKISTIINNTLLNTLNLATMGNGNYEFICTSKSIVEELNLIVSQKGPTMEPITKIRDLSSKYSCPIDTYQLLQGELN